MTDREAALRYHWLREKLRPLRLGWIALRTKFGFFFRRVICQNLMNKIRQVATVLLSQQPQPIFQFLVDFHVQNFVGHVDSGNL